MIRIRVSRALFFTLNNHNKTRYPMLNPFRFFMIAMTVIMLSSTLVYAENDAKSFYASGESKLKANDFNAAIADFTKALELNPKLVEAYLNRGFAKRSIGDAEGAKADFTKSIEVDPTPKDAAAYYNRALAKSAIGDKNGALSDYKKASIHGEKNAKKWLKDNGYN